jgi:hypothetical protein
MGDELLAGGWREQGASMKNYDARWSRSLIAISSLASVLCLGLSLGLGWKNRGAFPWPAALPLGLLVGAALFTIRGYAVVPGAILIHRLFWSTRLPITELESACYEPDAMRGSIRTFGNGGLFSFTGYFRNPGLGSYRAYVTDLQRTVVLRFPGRVVVLSPSAPDDFVRELTRGAVAETPRPEAGPFNAS